MNVMLSRKMTSHLRNTCRRLRIVSIVRGVDPDEPEVKKNTFSNSASLDVKHMRSFFILLQFKPNK